MKLESSPLPTTAGPFWSIRKVPVHINPIEFAEVWNWIWNLEQGLKWVIEIESNNHVQVARYDDEHKYLQALTRSIVNGEDQSPQ